MDMNEAFEKWYGERVYKHITPASVFEAGWNARKKQEYAGLYGDIENHPRNEGLAIAASLNSRGYLILSPGVNREADEALFDLMVLRGKTTKDLRKFVVFDASAAEDPSAWFVTDDSIAVAVEATCKHILRSGG